ncbi:unnamed protein product [Cyprideis torosa]|uniref:Uncharacterized protein n=1 Tax=Cyprideis torosa TaxID=163714 RepID=A0A7R8WIS1_9CRUS|nr:unnamed protein product [Cyprideis torosa]CAG0895122.1 unnamed protein product [Cyprideis torosa]
MCSRSQQPSLPEVSRGGETPESQAVLPEGLRRLLVISSYYLVSSKPQPAPGLIISLFPFHPAPSATTQPSSCLHFHFAAFFSSWKERAAFSRLICLLLPHPVTGNVKSLYIYAQLRLKIGPREGWFWLRVPRDDWRAPEGERN